MERRWARESCSVVWLCQPTHSLFCFSGIDAEAWKNTPWRDKDKTPILWPLLKSMFTYFNWSSIPNLADRTQKTKNLTSQEQRLVVPAPPSSSAAGTGEDPIPPLYKPTPTQKPSNQGHLTRLLDCLGLDFQEHEPGTWWAPLATGLPKEKWNPGRQGSKLGIQRV